MKTRKPRKKKQTLKGIIHSGVIFIGDAGFMADTTQNYPDAIIPNDPLNPFKDFDNYNEKNPADHNMELPGSFNGDLPGRGVVIHTNSSNGSYTVNKKVCKLSGKVLEVKIKFND